MRTSVLIRRMVIDYKELPKRLEELEVSTDTQFKELSLILLFSQPQQQEEGRPIDFAAFKRFEKQIGNDFGNKECSNYLYSKDTFSILRAVCRLPAFLYPFPKAHSQKRQLCTASQTVFS